ncbi:MAG: MBL fold metallo-hydrolase [Proteobacteria bacterium]|nr:MBL fold metallo-hydrolase [Pseudomonadota bacterium]MBU1059745.1 MBL fold metallo-hydrolase [Pseudomonadota bacterium]
MTLSSYEAKDLFQWLTNKEDILVLDVRNNKDFSRFQVESPYPFDMINVSYYDFMEIEEESVAKVAQDRAIRIVCAKEGSAKYVGEILVKYGFADVRYLSGGIKTWGNLLVPKLLRREEDYSLYQFIRPGKASCSYGLCSEAEMMLFDPSRNIEFYFDFAKSQGCKIIKTFETHLQADYIAGSRMIAEKTGAEFWANQSDFKAAKTNHKPLTDGESHRFSKGGPEVKVMFTPGHTPGSTTYLIDNKFMLSGDTIFIQSIGRPDLGGKAVEWAIVLFDTLQKIKKLDDKLLILPGHYMDWSEATEDLLFSLPIGQAKERNKEIYSISNVEGFIQFIQDNMRPQPPEYGTIRLANANLEQFEAEKQEELDLGKNECAATAYAKTQAAA